MKTRYVVFASALLLSMNAPVRAGEQELTTYEWVGVQDGKRNWADPANWQGGPDAPPSRPGDRAVINRKGNITLDIPGLDLGELVFDDQSEEEKGSVAVQMRGGSTSARIGRIHVRPGGAGRIFDVKKAMDIEVGELQIDEGGDFCVGGPGDAFGLARFHVGRETRVDGSLGVWCHVSDLNLGRLEVGASGRVLLTPKGGLQQAQGTSDTTLVVTGLAGEGRIASVEKDVEPELRAVLVIDSPAGSTATFAGSLSDLMPRRGEPVAEPATFRKLTVVKRGEGSQAFSGTCVHHGGTLVEGGVLDRSAATAFAVEPEAKGGEVR